MSNAQDSEKFKNIKVYASRVRKNYMNFNSEHLKKSENAYVGWLDIMGSGHLMTTSLHKTANFLARLHMAVDRSRADIDFSGRILAVNDGVFIVANKKKEIMSVMGSSLILLSANFIAVPRPHDRFLVRGGIAFGPVYFGGDLKDGLRPASLRESSEFLNSVMFGPPIIQAYRSEALAPPFGVAVHESARSFAPPGEEPFRLNHWLWWAPNEPTDYPKNAPPLSTLKDCLHHELRGQFDWLERTMIYQELTKDTIIKWRNVCDQYFCLG